MEPDYSNASANSSAEASRREDANERICAGVNPRASSSLVDKPAAESLLIVFPITVYSSAWSSVFAFCFEATKFCTCCTSALKSWMFGPF